MNEEQIKKKLLEQKMQQQQQADYNQFATEQQKAEMDSALKQLMLGMLDPAARERMNNIRVVKPDLYTSLLLYLSQMYQSGQLRGKITDSQLVQVLQSISAKKNTKISRK